MTGAGVGEDAPRRGELDGAELDGRPGRATVGVVVLADGKTALSRLTCAPRPVPVVSSSVKHIDRITL